MTNIWTMSSTCILQSNCFCIKPKGLYFIGDMHHIKNISKVLEIDLGVFSDIANC